MATDRIVAALAIATVIAFLAILGIWVPLVDLIVCMSAVVLLIVVDFYRQLGRREPDSDRPATRR